MMGPVLVTGGSRGIGRAIVESLVAEGRNVAFTYASDEKSARAVEEASQGRAKAFHLDLLDRARTKLLMAEVEEVLGDVDGLVNNAGVLRESILAMTSDHDWDDVMDVNLGGAFRCCRAVLPGMVHRRRGSIVNVSSLSAIHGLSGQTAYAATKAGLLGLTRALAREVGRKGIRVNAVLPGFVGTDLTGAVPKEAAAFLRAAQCMPREVKSEDVAALVSFLLSEKAAAVTGQSFVVDAGASV